MRFLLERNFEYKIISTLDFLAAWLFPHEWGWCLYVPPQDKTCISKASLHSTEFILLVTIATSTGVRFVSRQPSLGEEELDSRWRRTCTACDHQAQGVARREGFTWVFCACCVNCWARSPALRTATFLQRSQTRTRDDLSPMVYTVSKGPGRRVCFNWSLTYPFLLATRKNHAVILILLRILGWETCIFTSRWWWFSSG